MNANPDAPGGFAGPIGSVIDAMEDMIRACESGMNWMEQVSRARLSSATRGILTIDMGMCSSAIFKARKILAELSSNDGTGNVSRHCPVQGSPIQDLHQPSPNDKVSDGCRPRAHDGKENV